VAATLKKQLKITKYTNYKSEIRNPKEIRSPKAEFTPALRWFLYSDFGLLSDLGFRVSDFLLPYFVV